MYCIAADSEAVAATTMVYAIAPCSSSLRTTFAIVEAFWPIATYMQKRSLPFWLMMVSTATAVLPVWRSPMISSRWPRPTGTIASIALRPVCTGCDTDLRADHARRDLLDDVGHLGVDRALAVDGLAQRVDHAAEQLGADRHLEDAARALDRVALGDVLVLAQDHRADRVALEVQREPEGVAGELEHLALHHVGKAVDAADAVGHRDHGALRCGCRRTARGSGSRLLISSLISAGIAVAWLAPNSLLIRERAARHRGELAAHRGVDHLVADRDHSAADELRVDARRRATLRPKRS